MTFEHTCFVYGTLTEPARVETVVGPADAAQLGPAILDGLHCVEGEYPTLAPGGSVEGSLLAVDDPGLNALDEYEGVDRGLYVRVAVSCSHPDIDADRVWTYVGEPSRLDADAEWPGDRSFESRVQDEVADCDVVGPRS
ncbi:AIG2 family protein [Halovivax asiaticus JCM 14624]|uniref:AIG2 family protein n=1 Tax=Halovivax asiaticus JCM 14624 TaxID=1227490 RepID=M0BGT0_9EURY|nr:gamma-glutamylcyclotransferase family protein [Halovivax asiaticus]ELZ09488.1 AIG2 family protein [Halovivax asiaticus JCM 14624]